MATLSPRSSEELQDLFTLACDAHQHGQLENAKAHYLILLEYLPKVSMLHYNLGLVFYEQTAYESSRDCFARAAKYNGNDPDILFNLALSQKKCSDINGALNTYLQALEHDPGNIDCLYNLAGCYRDIRENHKAIETYLQVLKYSPEHHSATNNLAYMYHLVGDITNAERFYRKVLKLDPEHEAAQHMLASLCGTQAETTPESYIKDVFNNYSEHYEKSLVIELEYSVPKKLRGHVEQLQKRKTMYRRGIDLGCGTGLSGEAFVDVVTTFDGIDLSEKMIALAAQKGLYSSLYTGSILKHLKDASDCYDFFLAADVFTYMGELQEVFSIIKKRSLSNVLFCFSTETTPLEGYQLQPTGRFAHSPDYIKDLASSTGWIVLNTVSTALRKEKESWIQGDLWFLTLHTTTELQYMPA